MSIEEMMNMRGSLPVSDRPAFQEELQKHMYSMTPQVNVPSRLKLNRVLQVRLL